MKFKSLFVFTLLLLFSTHSFSENPYRFSCHVELGGKEANTSLNESWDIRQDVGSYNYSQNNSVQTSMYITHIAVKPEISLYNDKLAFSTGLSFSNISSDICALETSSNSINYYYLRYKTTGLNTEYAKVNSINQSSNYLGIPIDVKVVPYTISNIDFYLKIGLELNVKLNTNTKIDFVNSSMNEFNQSIIDNVGLSVNNIYSCWKNSIGVRIGNKNKLRYNFELILPSLFITNNNSTLIKSDMFTGFACSIQFPIKK